jgi:P27 family predicted phage terminase small subunit
MADYTGKKGRKALTDTQKSEKSYAEKSQVDSLKAPSFLPLPPLNMSEEAANEWRRVGEYLLLTDRVAKSDSQSLAFYANSYAMFAESTRLLLVGRQDLWGYIRGRPKPSKLVDVLCRHAAIVIKLSQKFGMTARTRHLDHKKNGRPATPQQIHDLRGTKPTKKPTASRNALAVKLAWPESSVAQPTWFNRDAVAEWTRTVEQLQTLELWTPLDVGPISVLCGCYSLAARCASDLADSMPVLPIRDAEGVVEHPLGEIYRELFVICESVWQDYGMTPHDRQQFHHIEGEQQGKPKLAVFPGEQA